MQFIDFQTCFKQTGFEKRTFNLDFLLLEQCQLPLLQFALKAYLGKSNSMLEAINCFKVEDGTQIKYLAQLQNLLLLTKLYKEILYSEKITNKSHNSFFLHLTKLTISNEDLKSLDDTQKKQTSLSLKLSLSALSYVINTLNILEPTAPLLVEAEKILTSIVKQSFKEKLFITDKYPKFLVYMF